MGARAARPLPLRVTETIGSFKSRMPYAKSKAGRLTATTLVASGRRIRLRMVREQVGLLAQSGLFASVLVTMEVGRALLSDGVRVRVLGCPVIQVSLPDVDGRPDACRTLFRVDIVAGLVGIKSTGEFVDEERVGPPAFSPPFAPGCLCHDVASRR